MVLDHATILKSRPTPAVIAIANAPPKRYPRSTNNNRRAPRARRKPTQNGQRRKRRRCNRHYDAIDRHQRRDDHRQRSADDERTGRRDCGLNGLRAYNRRDTDVVSSMGTKRIVLHELLGNLMRQVGLEASSFVNLGKFAPLEVEVIRKRAFFDGKIGEFGIGLRANGNVLTGRHGHGARNQTR